MTWTEERGGGVFIMSSLSIDKLNPLWTKITFWFWLIVRCSIINCFLSQIICLKCLDVTLVFKNSGGNKKNENLFVSWVASKMCLYSKCFHTFFALTPSSKVWRACNLTWFSPCLTGPVDYLFASRHKGLRFKSPGGVLMWNRDSPVSVVSLH
jgi:hypothetical protein